MLLLKHLKRNMQGLNEAVISTHKTGNHFVFLLMGPTYYIYQAWRLRFLYYKDAGGVFCVWHTCTSDVCRLLTLFTIMRFAEATNSLQYPSWRSRQLRYRKHWLAALLPRILHICFVCTEVKLVSFYTHRRWENGSVVFTTVIRCGIWTVLHNVTFVMYTMYLHASVIYKWFRVSQTHISRERIIHNVK